MDMNNVCRSCYNNDQAALRGADALLEALCEEISAALPRDAYMDLEERISETFNKAEQIAYEKGFFSGTIHSAQTLVFAASHL